MAKAQSFKPSSSQHITCFGKGNLNDSVNVLGESFSVVAVLIITAVIILCQRATVF